jgi:hypothetical protein
LTHPISHHLVQIILRIIKEQCNLALELFVFCEELVQSLLFFFDLRYESQAGQADESLETACNKDVLFGAKGRSLTPI